MALVFQSAARASLVVARDYYLSQQTAIDRIDIIQSTESSAIFGAAGSQPDWSRLGLGASAQCRAISRLGVRMLA
jgi:hypothetical protein